MAKKPVVKKVEDDPRYAMLLPLTEPAEHNSRPMLLPSFGIICWTTVSVL